LLALAAGGDTYKLKFGHRSQNQPCIEVGTKRCYITSQNHGYAVNAKPFMSVQFHPEATPGPVDTDFLFDKFVKMIKK